MLLCTWMARSCIQRGGNNRKGAASAAGVTEEFPPETIERCAFEHHCSERLVSMGQRQDLGKLLKSWQQHFEGKEQPAQQRLGHDQERDELLNLNFIPSQGRHPAVRKRPTAEPRVSSEETARGARDHFGCRNRARLA